MKKFPLFLASLLTLGAGAVTATVAQSALASVAPAAVSPVTWTADPADGSRVDEFDVIIITFNGASPTAFGSGTVTCTLNGQPTSYNYYNMRGSSVYFNVPRGSSYPTGTGKLELTVPEGYFVMSDGYDSPEIKYTLWVGEDPHEEGFNWVATPANGSTAANVNDFTITFPGCESVKISDDATYSATWNGNAVSTIMAGRPNGNTVAFKNQTRGSGLEGVEVEFTGEGVLTVTFDEGMFLLNGTEPSPEFTYTVNQDPTVGQESGDAFSTYISQSDPQVNAIAEPRDMGTYAFVMNGNVTINRDVEEPINLLLNGTMIGSVQPADDDAVATFDDNVISLDFGVESNAAGLYEVTIPAGVFSIDGKEADASTLKFLQGVGTFNPAAGSEINLDGGKLQKLVLTPFSGVNLEVNLNDDYDNGCKDLAVLSFNGEKIKDFDARLLSIYKGAVTFSFNAIEANGKLDFTFPAGFFKATINGVESFSPAFDVTFTVVGANEDPKQEYTLSPAAGSYDVFPTIKLTYKDCEGITVKEGAKAEMVINNTTASGLTFTISAEGNVVTLTPDEEYTTYGGTVFTKMSVKIPAGSYDLTYAGKAYPNVAETLDQYKIARPSAPNVTADPANGSTVENLNSITFTCEKELYTVQFTSNIPTLYTVVNGKRGNKVVTYDGALSADKKSFTLTPVLSVDLADGEYELVLPAGAYTEDYGTDKFTSKEQTFRYTVAQKTFAWAADPADGSEAADVNSFTITFPGFESVKISDDAVYTATWNGTAVSTIMAGTPNGNTVTFINNTRGTGLESAEPFTGEGELVVTFEPGMFVLDGTLKSPEFTYTVTQKPVTVEPGETFVSYVLQADPEVNAFAEARDMGAYAFLMDGNVTANRNATDPIVLKRGTEVLASLSMSDEDAIEVLDDTIISLNFGIETSDNGEYTITIPAGAFNVDGKAAGASTLKFLQGAGTFSPAAGSEINLDGGSLKKLVLNLFDIDIDVNDGEDGCTEKAVLSLNGVTVQEFDVQQLMAFKQAVEFKLNPGVDENGTLKFTFPDNFFKATLNGVVSLSHAFEVKWTVIGASEAPTQTYTLTPEAGTYDEMPTITITYDDVTSIAVKAGAKAELRVSNATTAAMTYTITAEGNVVTLTPDEVYNTYPGSPYTVMHVIVPAGSYDLTYGNKAWPNEALDIQDYKITAPKCPDVVADPESGSTLTELSVITCSVGTPIATFQNVTKYARLYPIIDGVRGASLCNLKSALTADKTGFTLTVPDGTQLTGGDYEVVIPAAYYICNVSGARVNSLEQVLKYTIQNPDTSVAGISADENVTVYTMTGVCVLHNVPAAELKNLQKGLYIVNGRKVLVK